MTKKIVDQRQAEEAYQEWRKEHPVEAAEADREWVEFQKDPLKLLAFMESKGFTFSKYDKEAVARREWQRLSLDQKIRKYWAAEKKWWNSLTKTQRSLICFAWLKFGCGVLVIFSALFYLTQLYPFAKGNVPLTALLFSATSILLSLGVFLLIYSLVYYCFYLEVRIKQLEKRQQVIDKWMEEFEEAAKEERDRTHD